VAPVADQALHDQLSDGSRWLTLSQVARELNATVELQRVLEIVLNEALRASQLSCGDVVLVSLEDGECVERFGRGCPLEVVWDPELELDIVRGDGTRLIDRLTEVPVFPGHPDLIGRCNDRIPGIAGGALRGGGR
jgi:hypothetical protein